MQHTTRAGKLEVDHFDPRQKNDLIQRIENLFPASRHCNGKKSNKWPNKEELLAGCRFLNPCQEMDYGSQIFEDPATHLLVGSTPAARWHIRMCGLNADQLVHERRKRSECLRTLRQRLVLRSRGLHHQVLDVIEKLKEQVALMIPEIPPVPASLKPKSP